MVYSLHVSLAVGMSGCIYFSIFCDPSLDTKLYIIVWSSLHRDENYLQSPGLLISLSRVSASLADMLPGLYVDSPGLSHCPLVSGPQHRNIPQFSASLHHRGPRFLTL